MKRLANYIINIVCVPVIIFTLFAGGFFILKNPINVDSLFVCSYIFMLIILRKFASKADMDKLRNIMILVIINIAVIVIPVTVLFILGTKIGGIFARDMVIISRAEMNMSYVDFLFVKIANANYSKLFISTFLLNLLAIIIIFVQYLIKIIFVKRVR